jgi:hypothetical protein
MLISFRGRPRADAAARRVVRQGGCVGLAWGAEPDSPSVPERVPRQQPGFARLCRSGGARAALFQTLRRSRINSPPCTTATLVIPENPAITPLEVLF